jgi:glycosyltransferase involved in cell wall biosynthesis
MRKGQNPSKMGIPAYRPKQLGVALLSYIPSPEGYFAQSLDILKYQIASLHASTREFDLLVFDNGSCSEVQDELRRLQADGLIHFLFLTPYNLGKTGALNWIFGAMPNNIICYADSDVFFESGWFEQSLDILDAFPNVGFVTAQPCFFDALDQNGHAHLGLENQLGIELYQMDVPTAALEEYVRGVDDGSPNVRDHLLKRWQMIRRSEGGQEAIIGASHMQFLARREAIRNIFPLPARYGLSREDDRLFNLRIDQAGLLQLSTQAFYVFHMGNRLDEYTLAKIQQMGLAEILEQPLEKQTTLSSNSIGSFKRRAFRIIFWLSHWSAFQKLFRRLYNFLFEFFTQVK